MHQLSRKNIPEDFTNKTKESYGTGGCAHDVLLQQFLSLPQDIRDQVIRAIRQELGEDQTLDGALLGSFRGGFPISIQGDGFFSTSDLDLDVRSDYLYLSSPKLKNFSYSPENQTKFDHFIFGDECVNLDHVDLVLSDLTTLTLLGVSPTIKLTKGIPKSKYTSVTIQGCIRGSLTFEDVVRIDRLSLIDCSDFYLQSNQQFLSIGHVELIN